MKINKERKEKLTESKEKKFLKKRAIFHSKKMQKKRKF